MKNIRKNFFKLFLIALLVMPMMVRALPSRVETKSYETILLDENNELTKEDYEEKNAKLCTICIILDIIIVICIVALVVRLIKLNREHNDSVKKDTE